MSHTENSISTARRCALTLALAMAPADKSEAVTVKPHLARPMA